MNGHGLCRWAASFHEEASVFRVPRGRCLSVSTWADMTPSIPYLVLAMCAVHLVVPPLSLLILVICVFSLWSIWLEGGRFHYFSQRTSCWFVSIRLFCFQFHCFRFWSSLLLTSGLCPHFFFLLSSSWTRGILIEGHSSIPIQALNTINFLRKMALVASHQWCIALSFSLISKYLFLMSPLTYGLMTSVSFCFQMSEGFVKDFRYWLLILLLSEYTL